MFATLQPWEGPGCVRNPLVGVKEASLRSGGPYYSPPQPPPLPGIQEAILLKLGRSGGVTHSEHTHAPCHVDFCTQVTCEGWGYGAHMALV